MIKKLKIDGKSDETILSISLSDILECVENPTLYNWKLLWIEGIGTYKDSILEFEGMINNSVDGVLFEYDELIKLSKSMDQIIELTLIVDVDLKKLIRYDEDFQMYENCKYVVELIDSSFWEFNTSVMDDIEKVKRKFEGGI